MPPDRHASKYAIYTRQRRQLWAVLALIIIGVVADGVQGSQHLGGSMAVGALLSFSAQSAFTYIAYRTTGARQRHAIMLNMYLGQMIKWLITLIGFALIFIYMKSVSAFAVIISYFIMQLVHIISMWRVK